MHTHAHPIKGVCTDALIYKQVEVIGLIGK